jgi:hypothetical protein
MAQQELQNAQAKVRGGPRSTVELAAASVRYKNGTFAMQGRLNAQVSCTEIRIQSMRPMQGGGTWVDKCTANVHFATAPEGQLAALQRLWRRPGMGVHRNDDWAWTSVRRAAAQNKQQSDAMIASSWSNADARSAELRHTMAVGQQMHQDFMRTMQEGTDRSMARAAEVANSNHRSAQDMVDYSLNRQTVMDPNTGQINKVSNQAAAVWSDGAGHMYTSPNPNANPNGILPGNWGRQTVVHGDGSQ